MRSKSSKYAVACVTVLAAVGLFLEARVEARSQVISAAAAEAAAKFADAAIQKMRGAGIIMTPEDIKAVQTVERHRAATLEMYRLLDKYGDTYRSRGDTARVAEINKHKARLRIIRNGLPGQNSRVFSYAQAVRRYLAGSSRKQREYIDAMTKDLETYKRDTTPKPPPPTVPSRPSRSPLEVYVGAMSGDMEFEINGVKVQHVGQRFDLPADGTFKLRAIGLGTRRKQIRSFKEGNYTTVIDYDDYHLAYRTQIGGKTGKTNWNAKDERYTWNVTRHPNARGVYTKASSGKGRVARDDVMAFKATGAFSFGATVTGETVWAGLSQRPGSATAAKIEQKDPFKGSITIAVAPSE